MNINVQNICKKLEGEISQLSIQRKILLNKLVDYISERSDKDVSLVFICTHNSRRSQLAQIWAAIGAEYFGVKNIKTYSGGTEATQFHINAIDALRKAGFKIESKSKDANPIWEVDFGGNFLLYCFSKVYNDVSNPQENFAAIMTCSDAEENCPFIPGLNFRLALTYDDPKVYDGTEQQEAKYWERSSQIATEMLYVFREIKRKS